MTFAARFKLKAGTGVVVLVGLVVLGALALTSPVTHDDLAVDQALHSARFALATTVSVDLTHAAQEAVGLGVLAVAVAVLFVRRRRFDAAVLVAMAGASWILALALKVVFDRPRPPARLWLAPPDHSGSFPSGHTTTAVVILLAVSFVVWHTPRWRTAVIAVGGVFALAVGASRLYLGDHYPTDVAGSLFTVAAAVLVVWALSDLPRVRHLASTLLREPTSAPARPRARPQPADQVEGRHPGPPRPLPG